MTQRERERDTLRERKKSERERGRDIQRKKNRVWERVSECEFLAISDLDPYKITFILRDFSQSTK